jgi:hypothetical protein
MMIVIQVPLVAQDFLISTPKQRLLPMKNSIEIIVDGLSFDSLYLTSTNGTVSKIDSRFIIHPERPGNTCIKVHAISGEDTLYIGNKLIDVHSFFQYTKVSLAGSKGGVISKESLLSQYGLSADVINQDIDIRFPISSFRVIILRDDSLLYTGVLDSNKFDTKTMNAFKETKSGDVLHFVDIFASNPKDKEKKYKLDGISIRIE